MYCSFPPIPSEDVRIVEPNVSRLQLFSGHVVFITTPADVSSYIFSNL